MGKAQLLSTTTKPMGNLAAALYNREPGPSGKPSLEAREFSFYYRDFCALDRITLRADRGTITALIGPSGCGKSTLLRAINRMHDTTPGVRAAGWLALDGQPIYHPTVDPVLLRRKISMIFQRPNPFKKSIFENVAYGLRLQGLRSRADLSAQVEAALRRAALWDEVKDQLDLPGTALSTGQQQRLCIARAIAPQPEVLLLDEPCSLLDPIATLKIEQLISELRSQHSIIIATHNLQQAARVSDQTAFMLMEPVTRAGQLIECGPTAQIFTMPKDPRTENYLSGRH